MVIALRSLKSRQPQVQLYGGLISSFALLCGDCQLWRRRCCLRFSSPCLAFLCPQTRLALPFPLLHIGEHLKRFPPLSGHLVCTWLFQVRKTQPAKAFAYAVPGPLGAERAASSYLVSSWDDGFHSTPGWGVCGCHRVHEPFQSETEPRFSSKNHVRAPGGLPEMRVLLLGLSLDFCFCFCLFNISLLFPPSPPLPSPP